MIGTFFFSAAETSGLIGAFHRMPEIEAGVLAVTAGLVCLIPRRPRTAEEVGTLPAQCPRAMTRSSPSSSS